MKAPVIAALLSLALSAPALAGTFVYVSNAEDGDIGMYTLQADVRCSRVSASRRKSS